MLRETVIIVWESTTISTLRDIINLVGHCLACTYAILQFAKRRSCGKLESKTCRTAVLQPPGLRLSVKDVCVCWWNARGSNSFGVFFDRGAVNPCTGEINAVTWPLVAVGEFFPLWRRGQPCWWTVSPTLMIVLCLELRRFISIFIFHPASTPRLFS